MAEMQTPSEIRQLPLAILQNMITLGASGFGLVVALAWNEAIKKFVDTVITPYLGPNGSLISTFVYAFVITIVAVLVTMQLTGLQRRLQILEETKDKKAKKSIKQRP